MVTGHTSLTEEDKMLIFKAVKIKHSVLDSSFSNEMALVCAGADIKSITASLLEVFDFENRAYCRNNPLCDNTEKYMYFRCIEIYKNAIRWPNIDKGQRLNSFHIKDMGTHISALIRLVGAGEEHCKGGND